jgi:hypothetical protein
MSGVFVTGLDLGQTSDPTALAVIEQTEAGQGKYAYNCRHLERFPLGTPYTDIVERVVRRFSAPPLRNSTLAVDETGVGRAVVDLLRHHPRICYALKPITITGGYQATKQEDGSYHVPKKDLVAALQVVMQSGRLKIAQSLSHAELLVKELGNFRVKITRAANEVYEAWREGDHDDLVLAVAMAVWAGERWSASLHWKWEPNPAALTEFAKAPPGVFLSDEYPPPRWG